MVAPVPPLRGPTRHKTAQKKKSGRSGRDDGKGESEEGPGKPGPYKLVLEVFEAFEDGADD